MSAKSVNCSLNSTSDHSWTLSNYNLTHGYPKDSQCIARIDPTPGYQLIMYTVDSNVELFDFLFVKSVMEAATLDTLYSPLIVCPAGPALFEFTSDGNIQYGGFTLNITEYDCRCQNKTYILPCDGQFIKYYSDDIDDEHAFCATTCFFNINIDESCRDQYLYATAALPYVWVLNQNSQLFSVYNLIDDQQHNIL